LLLFSFGQDLFKYVNTAYQHIIQLSHASELTNNKHKPTLERLNHPPKVYFHPEKRHEINVTGHQKVQQAPKYSCYRPDLQLIVGKKYYTLETNLGKGYEKFLTELEEKLTNAFELIEKKLGVKLNKSIHLKMKFETSRDDYEKTIQKYAPGQVTSIGRYFSHHHISIVEYQDHNQAITTAIHEAIHAFNYAYWGYTFRFINEGMAQYFQNITLKGDIPPFDYRWVAHQSDPIMVPDLIYSETDWHSSHETELYQNSKALFYFLMRHPDGRRAIWELLKQESDEPCSRLDKDEITKNLSDFFSNYEQEFDYWFKDGLAEY